jgi:signal transduction histidine kinase
MTLPHEVRTPLNQILGLTDYLKQSLDEVDKEETLEILEDVHSSAVRLRRLFENYLYLSALTINSYNIEELEKLQESTIYSAESLIYETATNISYRYEKNDRIELKLEDSPLQISEEHFNKLIYELVDNAFKFGNDLTKVVITSEVIDSNYKITIRDNGIGMPLEKIYMLDAYIQFDRLANEQQGSGLGLAIVKKIMDIYKGKINFKSEVGNFTEVTLFLPISDIDIDDI